MRPASHAERTAARMLRLLLIGFVVSIFLFLLAPIAVVVPMSFSNQLYLTFPPSGWSLRWYATVWEQTRWFDAAWNSLRIGAPAALLAVVFGTIAALAAVRSGLRWASVLGTLVLAPMMLPHVVIAIGLYPTMVDLGLAKTYLAVVIGHSVVAIPIVFLTVSASLKSYDHSLELAAMTLGADAWRTFFRVTLRMILPGVATGGIFAFATSFDELMLSLFLTGPRTETLPRLIWDYLAQTLTPAIAAVATLILAFSMLLLGLALLVRRGGSRAAIVPEPR